MASPMTSARKAAVIVIIVLGAALSVAGGVLAKTPDQCAASPDCSLNGSCSARWGTCVVGSDLDCAVSDPCRRHGLCRMVEGVCVKGMSRVDRHHW